MIKEKIKKINMMIFDVHQQTFKAHFLRKKRIT